MPACLRALPATTHAPQAGRASAPSMHVVSIHLAPLKHPTLTLMPSPPRMPMAIGEISSCPMGASLTAPDCQASPSPRALLGSLPLPPAAPPAGCAPAKGGMPAQGAWLAPPPACCHCACCCWPAGAKGRAGRWPAWGLYCALPARLLNRLRPLNGVRAVAAGGGEGGRFQEPLRGSL